MLEFQLDWVDDSFRSPLVGRVDLLDIRTQNITFRQMKAFDVVLTAQPPHDGSSNPLLNIKVAFQRYIPAVQVERDVPVEREEKGKLSTILIRKVVSEVLGELEYDQYLLAKGQNSSSYTINTRIVYNIYIYIYNIDTPRRHERECDVYYSKYPIRTETPKQFRNSRNNRDKLQNRRRNKMSKEIR